MGAIRSPITTFGGKGVIANRLIALFPSHEIYADIFGGGASMLLKKEPAPIEVYNDLDSDLVNFFRVLRDPEQYRALQCAVECTPVSREEFYFCRDHPYPEPADPVERARRFMVTCRQSFSGGRDSWTFSRTAVRRGMSLTCSHWLSGVEMLAEVHQRLMRVLIEHCDWERIFDRYADNPDVLIYADPPYHPDTRRSGGYKHELTAGDHEHLVERFLLADCKIMLSGYDHPAYQPLVDAGWRKRAFPIVCYATTRSRAGGIATDRDYRTETVWTNYDTTRGAA